jgi:predicted Zn-dependent protease
MVAFGTSRARGRRAGQSFLPCGWPSPGVPAGWIIENQRESLLAYTANKESVMQISVAPVRRQIPRDSDRETQGIYGWR